MGLAFFFMVFAVSAANAQSDISYVEGFQPFRKIILPAGYQPNSAVAVTSNELGSVHLFYRGKDMQLNHIHMREDGTILLSENLGGTLLTAPAAYAPGEGALDVVYVTLMQKVVLRTFRNGAWSAQSWSGLKSEFTPAVAGSMDATTVYATRLNMIVGSKTRTNGVWGSVQNHKFPAMDGPVILNRDGYEVYARKITNKVFLMTGPTTWIKIPTPKFTSGLCATESSEGGYFLFGRNAKSTLTSAFNIGDEWSPQLLTSPWVSDAPGCYYAYEFCAEIVIKQGEELYRSEYCS